MTNRETIVTALKSGKTLTTSLAVQEYRIYGLSRIIGDLRNDGYHIHSRSVGAVNSVGDRVTISEYWMASSEKKGPREWKKPETIEG